MRRVGMAGRRFALITLGWLLAACTQETPLGPSDEDSGTTVIVTFDAGVHPDATVSGDAGGDVDGGAGSDARPSGDGGHTLRGVLTPGSGAASNAGYRLRGGLRGSAGSSSWNDVRLRGSLVPAGAP